MVGNKIRFNISAFTHIGSVREKNQDSILVNKEYANNGFVNFQNQDFINCFVADGVGGNKAGEYASKYVLKELRKIDLSTLLESNKYLFEINNKLNKSAKKNENTIGSATTLSGIIYYKFKLRIIHSGDSEIWLLRNDSFIKITNEQVLNTQIPNSPITSYFGGNENHLSLDDEIFLDELTLKDKLLICSDGLFKAINQKQAKSVISADKHIENKTKKLLEIALQNKAEDNVSVILIDCIG